jgi:hypothetical protein
MTSETPSRAYKSLFEAAGAAAAVDMAAEAAAFEAAEAAFEAAGAAFEAAAFALAAAGAAAAAAGSAAAACHGEAAPSVEMGADRRADLSVGKPGSSTSAMGGCFRSNSGCLRASRRPLQAHLAGPGEHERSLGHQDVAEQDVVHPGDERRKRGAPFLDWTLTEVHAVEV